MQKLYAIRGIKWSCYYGLRCKNAPFYDFDSNSNAKFVVPRGKEAAPEPEELGKDGADDAVYHKELELLPRRDLGEITH